MEKYDCVLSINNSKLTGNPGQYAVYFSVNIKSITMDNVTATSTGTASQYAFYFSQVMETANINDVTVNNHAGGIYLYYNVDKF